MANRAPADHSAYVMSQKGGRIALLHFLPASKYQIGVAIPAAGRIREPPSSIFLNQIAYRIREEHLSPQRRFFSRDS